MISKVISYFFFFSSLFIYRLILSLLFLLLLPFFHVFSFFSPLSERVSERFLPFSSRPCLKDNEGKTLIWFHALSLGEMLSALPLIEVFLKKNPSYSLFCTASTRSGVACARKHLSGRVMDIRFFPLDHPFAVKKILREVSPDFFILVEGDLWPFFTYLLNKKKIPSFWVNARISRRSFKGYKALAFLIRPTINSFFKVFPQSREDAERLLDLGLLESRLEEAVNLKEDRLFPNPLNPALKELSDYIEDFKPDFIFICGSLHPGEEKILAPLFSDRRFKAKRLLSFIVPRNIERSEEIRESLLRLGVESSIFSERTESLSSCIILDSTGILADFYSLGDAALIGGSLLPFRGHNPLEAAMAGLPLMMGPHREDFSESFEELEGVGAAFSVLSSEEIADLLYLWLSDSEEAKKAGEAGKKLCMEKRGSALKVYNGISRHIL